MKKKKSKFDDITLPTEADGVVGYHARCYKSYISISDKKHQQNCKFFKLKYFNSNHSGNLFFIASTQVPVEFNRQNLQDLASEASDQLAGTFE